MQLSKSALVGHAREYGSITDPHDTIVKQETPDTEPKLALERAF
jgi:hypothetical protein